MEHALTNGTTNTSADADVISDYLSFCPDKFTPSVERVITMTSPASIGKSGHFSMPGQLLSNLKIATC